MRRILPNIVRRTLRFGIGPIARRRSGMRLNAIAFARSLRSKWKSRQDRRVAALNLMPLARRPLVIRIAQIPKPAASPEYPAPIRAQQTSSATRGVPYGWKQPRAAASIRTTLIERRFASLAVQLERRANAAATIASTSRQRSIPATPPVATLPGRSTRSGKYPFARPGLAEGALRISVTKAVDRVAELPRNHTAGTNPGVVPGSPAPISRPPPASRIGQRYIPGKAVMRTARQAGFPSQPGRQGIWRPTMDQAVVGRNLVTHALSSRRTVSRLPSLFAQSGRDHVPGLRTPPPLAGRLRRAERTFSPPTSAVKSNVASGVARGTGRSVPGIPAAKPSSSQRQAGIGAAVLADVEQSIAEKLNKRIDVRIDALVRRQLSIETGYARKIADHVEGTLHARLVLEKERLG
jgi:predicted N-formylglutamate amidohydrolase